MKFAVIFIEKIAFNEHKKFSKLFRMFDLRVETFSMLQEMNAARSCIISDPPIEFLTARDDARKANINHAPMAPHTRYLVHHHRWCEIRNFLLKCIAWCSKGKKLIGFWSNFGSNLSIDHRISSRSFTLDSDKSDVARKEIETSSSVSCRLNETWANIIKICDFSCASSKFEAAIAIQKKTVLSLIGSQTWNFIDFDRQRNWFTAKPLNLLHVSRSTATVKYKHDDEARKNHSRWVRQQTEAAAENDIPFTYERWNLKWIWVSVNGTLEQLI